MSRKIFQPNRSGLNSALDQVEEVLAKLKERVEANETHHREKETQAQFVDAQTSTTSLCPGYESRTNTKRKNTSVLISRRSSRLSNGSRSLRHKTNAKKNGGQTSEGSLSKHSHGNKIRRKERPNISEEDRLSSGTNPSTRHTHRKRSSSFSKLQHSSGRGSAHHVVDGSSRGSSEEILRRVHSQEGTLNNLENISWIPPLSQSSPREETPSRHKREPDHLKRTGRPIHKSNKASCSSSKQGLSKEETARAPAPFKPTIPVSGQSYAEPTLSSKLRTKLTESKGKAEKENVMTYIPSGHTSKSHHVGVIMQQKLGLLKTVPLKELKTLTEAFNPPEERIKETDSDGIIITEDVIKTALNNIRDHIAHAERQPN
ncbi:uncharacterized protein LOC135203786 [Macrobrachium nipponense]|uniref:uncharacterized protein LOC135203786 n=1 Tax=Macrobrachium nipponense TaxID=159736 RepID=UPI0030C7A7E8